MMNRADVPRATPHPLASLALSPSRGEGSYVARPRDISFSTEACSCAATTNCPSPLRGEEETAKRSPGGGDIRSMKRHGRESNAINRIIVVPRRTPHPLA